ncbi:tRNA(Ile)-lysidine synthase [Shewanella chilikensis]|uniref:tRNA(Ile)-lysidine synthase n=1 Tax=Shewanella chilikensis TaxID=558541 RepID=A0ABX5PRT6_9GAMM|nr:tRNA lysidine(34) synthetase TilS [Shewanella chilikensis]MCL1152771.1 tRNA lysidine(34) synthetase TilS [Shewanella chilikensis]PYE60393.1 tRNA(Ile)-lysidine synthase [Shewanella chilikensis]GGZ18670.1 tRNA(Ile)-lysidine synthase [Shewanella chilikensis]
MSHTLVDTLVFKLTALLEQIGATADDHLWLGYSGGMDSELLAYTLARFRETHPKTPYQISLVHVHHGLSCNADAWAAHCRQRAEHYGLNFVLRKVQLELGPRVSIEAEARRGRYQAIAELLNPGDILLTAHHQDDQLETLLLALKRGQGPKGLAAMGQAQHLALISKAESSLAQTSKAESAPCWQLRPMLDSSRAQIEQAVASLELPYINDESNQDTQYDRNFLRAEVIPVLKQRWPSIATTASRSAALCAEQQLLLDEVSAEKLQPLLGRCRFSGVRVLDSAGLKVLSPQWQAQLLRQFIQMQRLPLPAQVQLQQALAQLLDAREDAQLELSFKGLLLKRYGQQIYAMAPLPGAAFQLLDGVGSAEDLAAQPSKLTLSPKQLQALSQGQSLSVGLTSPWQRLELTLADSGPRVALAKVMAPQMAPQMASLSASPGAKVQPSDAAAPELVMGLKGSYRCQPHNRDKGRELKKLWHELGVPPWLRDRVPLLMQNGRLLALAGGFVERSALASGSEPGILLKLVAEATP